MKPAPSASSSENACEWRVNGMTCSTCEQAVKASLAEAVDSGAEVTVNATTGQLRIRNTVVSEAVVRGAVEKLGYTLELASEREKKRTPAVAFWRVLPWLGLFGVLIWAFQRAGWAGIDPGRLGSSALLVVGFGVLASASSCSAAVMSFLIAWQARFSKAMTLTSSLIDQAWFQAGRILGFSLFGGIIGVLGRQLSISVRGTGWLMMGLAMVMVWIALDLLGWVPRRVSAFSDRISAFVFRALGSKRSGLSLSLFGALTFFLPCAFTQTVQILALGAGGFWQGAGLLGLFALGTAPILTVIGVIASRTASVGRSWVSSATAALILMFALFQGQNAWRLTGLPSFTAGPATALASGMYEDGRYVVRIKVDNASYEPMQTRVPLGRPVELVVDGTSAQGCMRSLVIPAYNIREQLSSEHQTVVSFTPTRLGPVTFTCAMGMGDGKIFVVPESELLM